MSGIRFDRLRVMIVDDNLHMRRLIVAIMQAFGVREYFEAHDAEQAWAALPNAKPDIIILDWQLPGITGIEFARLVRTSPKSTNPFVPIIMLTGHTHVDHVRQARDAGINEFLAKPVSVKAMLVRLINVIENPRPFVRCDTYFGPCRRRKSITAYQGRERREPDLVTVD
ncbi:CheY-like chemotaxis protein [Rhizomicrobium palustre]|uniref:CheY-like chemotaxis protein n=1 Tax=Rhizomicrobium palustre TaxID=189966 RepID=A0A846N3U5_9PROT|nr:response regulator [Rhizomicrobium palustre]NIK89740.1 CheY-like chemotaxis protein [Rhizomicrobium palustre]